MSGVGEKGAVSLADRPFSLTDKSFHIANESPLRHEMKWVFFYITTLLICGYYQVECYLWLVCRIFHAVKVIHERETVFSSNTGQHHANGRAGPYVPGRQIISAGHGFKLKCAGISGI